MTEADTVVNGRVTVNQVRAARLVADLARTWQVPVPQTLQDIAETELGPGSTNGHASRTRRPDAQDTTAAVE